MRVKIMADSACDLPRELLERYDITLLPLHIRMGKEEKLDGVEIIPADVFSCVYRTGELPSTAAISPGRFAEAFQRYAAMYDAVICVTISAEFSSCYQNALIASEPFSNVCVVDSRGLSSGEGLVALEAARLARAGLPPEEICARLLPAREQVDSSFILNRLDYMKKGGRCNAVAALGANLLQLKPCIRVRDGKMDVIKKYRGSLEKALREYVRDILAPYEASRLDEVIVVYPPTRRTAVTAVKEALEDSGRFSKIWEADASCTIACHCGPDTIGVMFLPKSR